MNLLCTLSSRQQQELFQFKFEYTIKLVKYLKIIKGDIEFNTNSKINLTILSLAKIKL